MKYNLSSSQSDRYNFDKRIHQFAWDVIAALHEYSELDDELLNKYWEQFAGDLDTDDPEEAFVRFKDLFTKAWRREIVDLVRDFIDA